MNLFFAFLQGGRPGYLVSFPRKVQMEIKSELGTWISSGFGVVWGFCLCILFFACLQGGPRVLSKFLPKTTKTHPI